MQPLCPASGKVHLDGPEHSFSRRSSPPGEQQPAIAMANGSLALSVAYLAIGLVTVMS